MRNLFALDVFSLHITFVQYLLLFVCLFVRSFLLNLNEDSCLTSLQVELLITDRGFENTSSVYHRGAQVSSARFPGQLNSIHWRLIFLVPQYGNTGGVCSRIGW